MKFLVLMIVLLTTLALPGVAFATPSEDVVIGIDGLEPETDSDYWDRLFVQCGSWLPQYEAVKEPAKARLIEIGAPCLEHLIPTWYASPNVRHRVTMEEIIKGIGPSAVPFLTLHLDSNNPVLRQRIITSLGDLDDPAVLPALAGHLPDEREVDVLPALLEALGKRGAGHVELVEPIALVLGHPDERVRRSGVVALGRIGEHAAAVHLLPLLDDRQFGVRMPAQEALFGIYRQRQPRRTFGQLQMPEAGPIGRALLIELDVALALLGYMSSPSEVERVLLSEWTDSQERQAVLRGIHRAWKVDHGIDPQALDLLQVPQSAPGPEAVRREVLAAIAAQEAREAAANEATP